MSSFTDFSELFPDEPASDDDNATPYGFVEDLAPTPDADSVESAVTAPSSDFVQPKPQGRVSKQYEKKTRSFLQTLMLMGVSSPETVADSAAIILYGPKLSRAAGDASETNARVRAAVDFVSTTTDNPLANLVIAGLPLAMQLVRNHEPVLEPSVRGIKIPFIKRRITLKFGIKLGRLRAITREPVALESAVFDDPEIAASLERQEIPVARSRRRDR